MDFVPPTHPPSAVRTSLQVLNATLPRTAAAAATQAAATRVDPRWALRLQGEDALLVTSAAILARSWQDDAAEAVELCDAALERFTPAARLAMPAATLSAFHAAIAEAHATAGWPRKAAFHAAIAARESASVGSDEGSFRAHALLAVSHALNAEYADARAAADTAHALARAHGWGTTRAFYPLLLGEIMLHSSTLDAPGLRAIVAQLRETLPDDTTWQATAITAESMALLVENETSRALATVMAVTNGTERPGVLRMIRGFAVGVHADALLARGEGLRTLGLLSGEPSPAGHSLCFDMQRASAHLQLGENRQALHTTDQCVRLGMDHCLRTLSPILFRRAIANHRLGHQGAADRDFEDAVNLVLSSGSATPLLTLPRTDLLVLLERLAQSRPDLKATLRAFQERLAQVPPVRQGSPLPALTPRERVLAERLRDETTIAAQASALHVSPNTLKTQLRSLYRKLGVGSRDAAVLELERHGFYG